MKIPSTWPRTRRSWGLLERYVAKRLAPASALSLGFSQLTHRLCQFKMPERLSCIRQRHYYFSTNHTNKPRQSRQLYRDTIRRRTTRPYVTILSSVILDCHFVAILLPVRRAAEICGDIGRLLFFLQEVVYSEGILFLDDCDFSGSSASVLVYSANNDNTVVRNTVLGDNNCEFCCFCVQGQPTGMLLS